MKIKVRKSQVEPILCGDHLKRIGKNVAFYDEIKDDPGVVVNYRGDKRWMYEDEFLDAYEVVEDMKAEKCFFKTTKQLGDYFQDESFKFYYMSDGMVCFESLEPHNVDGDLYKVAIEMRLSSASQIFCYEKFHTLIARYEPYEVYLYKEGSGERVKVYDQESEL